MTHNWWHKQHSPCFHEVIATAGVAFTTKRLVEPLIMNIVPAKGNVQRKGPLKLHRWVFTGGCSGVWVFGVSRFMGLGLGLKTRMRLFGEAIQSCLSGAGDQTLGHTIGTSGLR